MFCAKLGKKLTNDGFATGHGTRGTWRDLTDREVHEHEDVDNMALLAGRGLHVVSVQRGRFCLAYLSLP